MNQESQTAINSLISQLNYIHTLSSNIEVVWALEQLSKDAANEAAKIRFKLESEQAKD